MLRYLIDYIEIFYYNNWKLFTISGDSINFIYLCVIAFFLGVAHGLIN